MKHRKIALSVMGVLLLASVRCHCQTALYFTNIIQTPEQAIQLTWTSVSNEIYEIDEADALNTNYDGTTQWNVLYSDYPSQGSNTFWLDTGNYNLVPQISHPKYVPLRFYRIVDKGADTTSDEPSVFITTPTNGAVASGEITLTVLASTDQPVLAGTKLYVDGQEMPLAASTTNYANGATNYEMDTYTINTCEWLNGSHVLFATAECESGYGDTIGAGPIATGHGVSPLVPVIFNNLVTEIAFSQPSFDPSSGQIQQVSALFTANSDWTLTIRDVYSNAVRTVTGSGNSLLFNWDGSGDGGTNLPNGIYFYYISAQTNGQANNFAAIAPGGVSGESALSLSSSSGLASGSDLELWAMPADGSGGAAPFSIYPPGFDTNHFTFFEATHLEMLPMVASPSLAAPSATMFSGDASPDGTGITPLPNPQSAPPAPQRPPINPVRGLAGSFGVVYDTYTGNGTYGFTLGPLDNGLGYGGHISLNGNSAGASLTYPPLPVAATMANNFISQMQHWGWNNSLLKFDNTLNINDLRGSGSPLNNVNLAVFLAHGAYGTGSSAIDYTANQCKQMYFPITSGTGAQYLRLSEMNLGGSGTNGLKWMLLFSCNSLQHNNWASMQNAGIYPYNGNLHLLLGADTTLYGDSSLLWYWAKYINYGTSPNADSYSPLTIRAAWYKAAQTAYASPPALPVGTVITLAVAGDSACLNDSLQTNSPPSGSWQYTSQPVYP